MQRTLIVALSLLLPACTTLHDYGIGGPPRQVCRDGKAHIDDKLAGSDSAWLSIMRRFKDGDAGC